jgi:oxygen-independent coproporphyrinogen-3 oxidase
VTGVGMVANSYSQNVKTLDEYAERLSRNELPVFRGIELNADDILRRYVINRLMCEFELDMGAVAREFGLVFEEYFAWEIGQLKAMQADGLLRVGSEMIEVSPAGRLLIRNVCMVFDKYLRQQQEQRFSRVI